MGSKSSSPAVMASGGAAKAKVHATGWQSALRGAVCRRSMCRTVPAAAIVGSTLFMVNLFSSVRDDPFTWVRASQIMLTFLVPWLNATMGIAIGLRHGNPASTAEAG